MEGIEKRNTLRFSDDESQAQFLLFEMSEEMLKELEESGRYVSNLHTDSIPF